MRPARDPRRFLELHSGVLARILPGQVRRRPPQLRHWLSSCPGYRLILFSLLFYPFPLWGGEHEFFYHHSKRITFQSLLTLLYAESHHSTTKPLLTKLQFIEPIYARRIQSLPQGQECIYYSKMSAECAETIPVQVSHRGGGTGQNYLRRLGRKYHCFFPPKGSRSGGFSPPRGLATKPSLKTILRSSP